MGRGCSLYPHQGTETSTLILVVSVFYYRFSPYGLSEEAHRFVPVFTDNQAELSGIIIITQALLSTVQHRSPPCLSGELYPELVESSYVWFSSDTLSCWVGGLPL